MTLSVLVDLMEQGDSGDEADDEGSDDDDCEHDENDALQPNTTTGSSGFLWGLLFLLFCHRFCSARDDITVGRVRPESRAVEFGRFG